MEAAITNRLQVVPTALKPWSTHIIMFRDDRPPDLKENWKTRPENKLPMKRFMATEATKNLRSNGDIFQALWNASMLISIGELTLKGLKKVTFVVAINDLRVSNSILANGKVSSGFFLSDFWQLGN